MKKSGEKPKASESEQEKKKKKKEEEEDEEKHPYNKLPPVYMSTDGRPPAESSSIATTLITNKVLKHQEKFTTQSQATR